MLKSHIEELRELLACIRMDVCDSFPHLAGSIGMDLRTLNRSIDARGLPLLVEDLPRLGKHLDRCLSDGQWKPSALPLSKRASAGCCLPRFLAGLWLLVFDGTGRLREEPDAEAIFFLRQVCYLGKKARIVCEEQAIDREVEVFFSLDASLPTPERYWSSDEEARGVYEGFEKSNLIAARVIGSAFECGRVRFLRTLDKTFSVLVASLGAYVASEWAPRHGPGAVSEISGRKDKYLFDNWPDHLERVYPCAEWAFHSYCAWTEGAERLHERSRSSRLIAVPKTYSKPRLIAAEPSEHMWCQQSIWRYMRERSDNGLIGNFIKFRDQSQNQELCLRGSSDGKLCTIDLSAASDRVTCHVVGQVFRHNLDLLEALRACRTRSVYWPKGPVVEEYDGAASCLNGREAELRKFSTMGSACTFPVESIIFLGICIASVLYVRKKQVTRKNIADLIGEVSVFGDDLIIPEDSWDCVTGALELLWFKVNTDKSFRAGLFRESCGVDAYAGVPVTPVYWHSPCTDDAESIVSYVETHNNFMKKFLLRTSAYLRGKLPKFFQTRVPIDSDVLGLSSFCRPPREHYISRWNKGLHRMEVRLAGIEACPTLAQANGDSALLKFFSEERAPFSKWSAGTLIDVRTRRVARWVAMRDLNLK